MGMLKCQKCGEVSYSADRTSQECPFCGIEKLFVINPEIIAIASELSDAKLIIDRRVEDIKVEVDRRKSSKGIPLGWLCYSAKSSS